VPFGVGDVLTLVEKGGEFATVALSGDGRVRPQDGFEALLAVPARSRASGGC
jgi:hypothetical protein